MAREADGGIDIDSETGLYALLRSIEWVPDTIGLLLCSRCGGENPNHRDGCELAAYIAREREVLDMLATEDAERAANPGLQAEEDVRNWRRLILAEVGAERRHQIEDNGYTAVEDDGYENGELARAAAAMLLVGSLDERDRAWFDPDAPATARSQYGWKLVDRVRSLWPFPNLPKWKGRREDMIRGLAMGVAEVERLDRAARALDDFAHREQVARDRAAER